MKKKNMLKGKTMSIGIGVKSPFNDNNKPANKLMEKQQKASIFAAEKRNPFLPPQKSSISDKEDYCTCERCPHCGKKIRRTQPMWSVSF